MTQQLFWDTTNTENAHTIINEKLNLGDQLAIVIVTFVVCIALFYICERVYHYVKEHKKNVKEAILNEIAEIDQELKSTISPDRREMLIDKRAQLKGKIN